MPSNFDNFLEFCLKLARKTDTDDEEETLTPFCFAESRSSPDAGLTSSDAGLASPNAGLTSPDAGRSMASVPRSRSSQTPAAIAHSLDKPQNQQPESNSERQEERKLRLLQRLRLRITMNFQQRNKVFAAATKFEQDGDDETALECFLFCLEGEGE